MDVTKEPKADYRDLLIKYGEEDIKVRIDRRRDSIQNFLTSLNLSDEQVRISDRNLQLAVLSFSSDLKRIEPYHNIQDVNVIKIHSYEAYWLLRKKPIQIVSDFDGCERINERYVAFMLTDFLLRDWGDAVLSGQSKKEFKDFAQTLYYSFSYRNFNAQNIELVLLGFRAGIAVGENLPEKYFGG